MVSIKSDREIELMREAGKILASVHNEIANYIKPYKDSITTVAEGPKSAIETVTK